MEPKEHHFLMLPNTKKILITTTLNHQEISSLSQFHNSMMD